MTTTMNEKQKELIALTNKLLGNKGFIERLVSLQLDYLTKIVNQPMIGDTDTDMNRSFAYSNLHIRESVNDIAILSKYLLSLNQLKD